MHCLFNRTAPVNKCAETVFNLLAGLLVGWPYRTVTCMSCPHPAVPVVSHNAHFVNVSWWTVAELEQLQDEKQKTRVKKTSDAYASQIRKWEVRYWLSTLPFCCCVPLFTAVRSQKHPCMWHKRQYQTKPPEAEACAFKCVARVNMAEHVPAAC
jgi:hypothetical protein